MGDSGGGIACGTYRPLIAGERGSAGSIGSEGMAGKVQRIKIWKRRGVLGYTVCTKDEKPVNFLNLQNLFNLSVNAMDLGEAFLRKSPLTLHFHHATIILQKGFQYLIVHKRMTPHEITRARGGSSCSKHKTKLQAYHTLPL